MAYSVDFRKKVLLIQEQEGLSCKEAAKRFGIGIASVIRWRSRLQRKQYSLNQARKIDMEKLAQDVKDYPDAFQYERAARFGVVRSAIWSALGRLNITNKKNSTTPKGR